MKKQSPSADSVTYSYTPWRQVSVVFWSAIGLYTSLQLVRAESWLVVIGFVLGIGAVIYAGYFISYKLMVNEYGLQQTVLMQNRQMAWSEVGGFRGLGSTGYILFDRNHQRKFLVSTNLGDFEDLNEQIRKYVPEIWNAAEKSIVLDRTFLGISSGALILLMLCSILFLLENSASWLLSLILFLPVGVRVAAPFIRAYRKVSMIRHSLLLEPLIGPPITLTSKEILAIELRIDRMGSIFDRGRKFAVILFLQDKTQFKLANFEDGAGALVNRLRNWHDKETAESIRL